MPVQNPTAGDVHVNRPLTTFAQSYSMDESRFVALRAWPNHPVQHQSDTYFEFDRADLFRDEAVERADGTESAGGGFRLSTRPYTTRVFAFHKDITDRQRANEDPQVNLEMRATRFVMQKLLLRRERMMVDAFFNPVSGGNFAWFDVDLTDGSTETTKTGNPVTWSGGSTTAPGPGATSGGNPIYAVRTAIRGIHQRTGIRPNRMLMGRQAYDILLDNDEILSRIFGGATTSQPAKVMKELIAALFEVDEIIVMDAVYNSQSVKDNKVGLGPIDVDADADDQVLNTDENMTFIGGNRVLLYYAPMSAGMEEPTAGIQFSWTGFMGASGNGIRIKRMRSELTESDRIEGQMAFDYKVTAPDLGTMFTVS